MSAAGSCGPRDAAAVVAEFHEWVRSEQFSCLGARSALNRGQLTCVVYSSLAAESAPAAVYRDLVAFVARSLDEAPSMASFTALFPVGSEVSDRAFEQELWAFLSRLRRHSEVTDGVPLPHGFSDDIEDPEFAVVIAGHPFFVVGLHSGASRVTRRSAYRAVAFNSHVQFAALKASGVYARLQARIRERELKLQGTLNPMLADRGERSEAIQYSGRCSDIEDWQCPVEVLGDAPYRASTPAPEGAAH